VYDHSLSLNFYPHPFIERFKYLQDVVADMVKCHQCSGEYKSIGLHWAKSDCDYPELSNFQGDVLTGLLLGDGSINSNNGDGCNPRMECSMVTKEYLDYLNSDVFPILGTGVTLTRTAEESFEQIKSRDFRTYTDSSNYSDVYRFRTRKLPELKKFLSWYDSGEKVFPENIELSPTVLKHWYCGDGHYRGAGGSKYITINVSNEVNNKQKIESMFSNIGLPVHSWNISERSDGSVVASIYFSTYTTDDFFDYIGDSLPGFGYKWP
jgi:hypothetical protein